jgi:hypothetical protein
MVPEAKHPAGVFTAQRWTLRGRFAQRYHAVSPAHRSYSVSQSVDPEAKSKSFSSPALYCA